MRTARPRSTRTHTVRGGAARASLAQHSSFTQHIQRARRSGSKERECAEAIERWRRSDDGSESSAKDAPAPIRKKPPRDLPHIPRTSDRTTRFDSGPWKLRPCRASATAGPERRERQHREYNAGAATVTPLAHVGFSSPHPRSRGKERERRAVSITHLVARSLARRMRGRYRRRSRPPAAMMILMPHRT